MRFEWDFLKAASNIAKHQIAFEMAVTVFYDPFMWIQTDWDHSITEIRERVVGESDGRILVVIYTKRGEDIYRIISARPASRDERIEYALRKRAL